MSVFFFAKKNLQFKTSYACTSIYNNLHFHMYKYTYTGTFFAMAKFADLIDPVTQDFEVNAFVRILTKK